jgi:UDP-GlcNAc3NAcA epimerase
MKMVTILGARPQFIKAGSVSREISRQKSLGAGFEEIIIHTGQHYDTNMSDVFFEEMQIPKPKYSLGIGGNMHGAMTGQMIEKIEEILVLENPDWVMVYGDTNSTLAGAIAASKLHIKVAHVEAGLRSFNMRMPEEVNRILTDRISSILFCPTQTSINNLIGEGIKNWEPIPKVSLVGDVMLDGALYYKKLAHPPEFIDVTRDFVLCTIHRAENTDDPARLNQIMSAMNEIALTKQVILPLHPRTKKLIQEGNYYTSDLTIIDPVGYLNMVWLIDNSSLVMTDSGGLQKEAYYFSKPCITLRDETEWVELVESSVNILAGADTDRILEAFDNTRNHFANGHADLSLYGNGQASQKIVDELIETFSTSVN